MAGGLGGEFEGEFAAGPGLGEAGGAQPVGVGGAEELAGEYGPAQLEVGVVLPGETDAAEDLDGVLGAAVRGLRRGGGGERGGEPAHLGLLVGGAGRVPGQGAGLLQADEHVGAEVLDGLERPDGPPELFAYGGVCDGRVQAPGGGAAGVGGEEDGGQVPDEVGIEGGVEGQNPLLRYVDGFGPHLRCGPGRVDAAVRAHGEPLGPGVHEEPALAVGCNGGQEQQVGRLGGEDGRGGPVETVAARGRGGGEGAGGEGEGGGTVPRGEAPDQVTGPGAHRPPHHLTHKSGGEAGPRQRGVGGLLQDHGEVQETAAPAPVLLGQMDPGQPLPGERLPVGGAHPGGGRAPASRSLRTSPGGAARASHPRTECASARCSSVMPMPVPMPMRILAGRSHWNGGKSRTRSIMTEGQMSYVFRELPHRPAGVRPGR
ncbi:hypothetical protein Smic_20840 [Streptomyces microflavus]|uniref:Uncharacterized protein n=1 Tax=Streptomyces microflavus TaxID=1919 RepID=A0A7J0CMJ9_STRMI|nr:hypothetical protein Smic_20840 [Streptomyces microflavus]